MELFHWGHDPMKLLPTGLFIKHTDLFNVAVVSIMNFMNDLTSQMKSPQRIASFADNPFVYRVLLLHFTEEIPSYIWTKLKIQISSTYMRNSISFTIVL